MHVHLPYIIIYVTHIHNHGLHGYAFESIYNVLAVVLGTD